MKKIIIISGSIYLTLLAAILIAQFTDVYGILTAILVFLLMVSAIIFYDLFIMRSIQKISDSIQQTTDMDLIIDKLNGILKKKLTNDQVLKTQFLLVIAYTYKQGGLEKAKSSLEEIDFSSKQKKYEIIKLDCLLAFDIIEEKEKEYFVILEKEKDYTKDSVYSDNKKIMTYYFQLLKDFYQPSLETEVNEIIKKEIESGLNLIPRQFYEYLNLLTLNAKGLPLVGLDELKNHSKGTYLFEKLEKLETY